MHSFLLCGLFHINPSSEKQATKIAPGLTCKGLCLGARISWSGLHAGSVQVAISVLVKDSLANIQVCVT